MTEIETLRVGDGAEGREAVLPASGRYLPAVTGLAGVGVAVFLAVLAGRWNVPVWQPLALAGLAFCCEFMDSSLGMGYGTTLTPILVMAGLDLKAVVPVTLFSEFVTGLTAGGFHNALGNCKLTLRSRDLRVTAALALAGIAGALGAVQFLTRVPRPWARLYFALMIAGMGLLILARRRKSFRFSWAKIASLGLVSAFNKGVSGGGYGPLVVGGQLLSGCSAKAAVACTSLSESFICLVALVGFAVAGVFPAPELAVPLTAGAVLSSPCACTMTRLMDSRVNLNSLLGVCVLALGLLCLIKVPGA